MKAFTLTGFVAALCFSCTTFFACAQSQSPYSVKDAGAKGDGVTDDTQAFQKALDGHANVVVPKGRYLISSVNLHSDLQVNGDPGAVIVCADIKSQTTQNGTFYFNCAPKSTNGNVTIKNLTFEVNAPYQYNKYPACILFSVHHWSSFQHLDFENLVFKNPCDNAILLLANQGDVGFQHVKVVNCKGYGSEDYKAFAPANLIRLINNSDPKTNYGNITAKDITVTGCYAKYLRTLADIKRGCADVVVDRNTTVDMHDCNYSIDGSFRCTISNNTSQMDLDFLMHHAFTGVNFLEAQGEDIKVLNNKIDKQSKAGIFITDYAFPAEGPNAGHQSKNIEIRGNTIDSIMDGHGIKILNAQNVTIADNKVRYAKYWGIDVDSKTGRNLNATTKLSANNITLINNQVPAQGIKDNINNKSYRSNEKTLLLKQQ